MGHFSQVFILSLRNAGVTHNVAEHVCWETLSLFKQLLPAAATHNGFSAEARRGEVRTSMFEVRFSDERRPD